MPSARPGYVILVKCPDQKGIVAAVASYLADNDASIEESGHFNDHLSNRFYMRTAFRADGPNMPSVDTLRKGFAPIAERFEMEWQLHDTSVRPRIMVMVSKFDHCANDLLHRWRTGALPVDICAVVSNHETMRSFVEWNAIPFHYLPISEANKVDQEAKLSGLIDDLKIDLVVLARYMQVLSPDLCSRLAGRCINIHHSFLPSFKGAKPYHQAHARGVKIIGATAHYVTDALDEGPIIDQGVEHVTHGHTPDDLVAIGRDIECKVLARAVTWHVEHRVFADGHKTIIFP